MDDLVKVADQLKADSQRFVLSPTRWNRLSAKVSLDWGSVRFAVGSQPALPSERGVYMFIIQRRAQSLPPHGYIMYVGITGDRRERTLQMRYASYSEEKQRVKRAAIYYMLNKWNRDVYFHFAPVPDRRRSLAKLEQQLTDALIPPINSNDFSAEVATAVRAFRHA